MLCFRSMTKTTKDPETYPRLLTVRQACACLQLSKPTVYDLIHSGRLRSVSVGRVHRIPVQAIEEFIAGADSPGAA